MAELFPKTLYDAELGTSRWTERRVIKHVVKRPGGVVGHEAEGNLLRIIREVTNFVGEKSESIEHPIEGNLIKLVLEELTTVYDPWFTLDEEGGSDQEKARSRFHGWQQRFGRELVRTPSPRDVTSPRSSAHLMAYMQDTERNEHRDPNPHARYLGNALLFGGWSRKLDATALLRGPVWFGWKVSIRSHAKIIGPVLIGNQTKVGSSTTIVRSIVGHKTELDGGVQVTDALIGSCVYIGPGTKFVNKPLNGDGRITVEDRRTVGNLRLVENVQRAKVGPIIGDDCRIGANVSIEPGTILLPGCVIPHGKTVTSGVYSPEMCRIFCREHPAIY